MKKSKDLKANRASKYKAQDDIIAAAKADGRDVLNDDEKTRFDNLQTEAEALTEDINRAEKLEKRQADDAASEGVNITPKKTKEEKREEPFSFIRAINNARNNRAHEGAEKIALDSGLEEIRTRGLQVPEGVSVAIPSHMLVANKRDITVDGDSGTKGGKLVASNPSVVMPLLPSLKLQEMGANVMTGLVGDIPLISGDEFTFSYVAENAEVSGTDVEFAGPTLSPKRLAGVVDISNKWLVQTTPAAEANVKALIAAGIEAAIVRGAIVGGGASGPTGLYDAITTNVQAGAAGAATWVDVIGLKTLIKSANATKKNLYYLSDPALKGSLETTKKDAGSGIFICENDKLAGYNYEDSTLVGTLDAGASHPLIFGDWKQMAVGFWSGVSFIVDPLTQAPKGKTRLIFNLYNDVAVANEKAFAIRKNFTV